MLLSEVSNIGGDAVITLPAVSGHYYSIDQIYTSYSGALSSNAGSFKVSVAGTEIFNIDIHSGDIINTFPVIQSNDNEQVVLTLKGIVLMTAKLNISYNQY